MTPRFMQMVDFWVGIPLCAVLTLINAISRRFRTAQAVLPVKALLFIELSEMGSAILAHSALLRAQALSGAPQLYFLIFASNRESIELLQIIPKERILTIDDSSFLALVLSTLRILLKIRSIGFDAVLDLELFSRFTTILSALSGARNRVGFHNYTDEGLYRGTLLTHPVLYNGLQHMALNFLALVEALNCQEQERPFVKKELYSLLMPLPSFSSEEHERRDIWQRLEKENPAVSQARKIVILNPDAGALPLRGWPLPSYGELARRILAADSESFVIVMGLAAAYELGQSIGGVCGKHRFINFAGKTRSLREVLILLSLGHVFVTSDSGPAHMASLTDIKLVVFFGPESAIRYAPLTAQLKVFQEQLSCSPCFSAANHRFSRCANNICMQRIDVARVLTTVLS